MLKKTVIDNDFIRKWEAEYDKIEHDEGNYQCLIAKVREEVRRIGTLSRGIIEEIYNWKAPRAKGYVEWEKFGIYENSFRETLRALENQKIAILVKRRGIGIPVASTILHFIYPNTFPIVDVRTERGVKECRTSR